jgi:hypothetical protein
MPDQNNTKSVRHYDSEDDFLADFYAIEDKKQQIESLYSFRHQQHMMVQNLINIISALSGKQYTNRSQHFFLELLQNADDNEYYSKAIPSVEFELVGNKLIIRNNEIGFTAENVNSITTAAKSTKYKLKDNNYIGEKGIGFKSVFAVADSVEIHSNGYHFYLKDREYIKPHWIDKEYKSVANTEIVLHLKQDKGLQLAIEEGLQNIVNRNLGMMLFLRKIKRINVKKNGELIDCLTMEQRGKYREITTKDQGRVSYYIYKYQEKVSMEELRYRYMDLFTDTDLEYLMRDVIFAVPDPSTTDISEFVGKYFAFLQTDMTTGMPIHIQVDAETNTAREAFVKADASIWNKTMLQNLESHLKILFEKLTQEERFKYRILEYLPDPKDDPRNANEDLTSIYRNLCDSVQDLAVFLDIRGKWRTGREIVIFEKPDDAQYLFNVKYEKHLPECFEDVSDKLYLMNKEWNRVGLSILRAYQIKSLCSYDYFTLLQEGPPDTIDELPITRDDQALKFLAHVQYWCRDIDRSPKLPDDLRQHICNAKIFPIRSSDGKKRLWITGIESKPLRWQSTSSKNARIPSKRFNYIDSYFTFSPGSGTKDRDTVAAINGGYKDFLNRIGIKQHTILNSLLDDHVAHLRRRNIDPDKAEKHLIMLYSEYWLRRKTLLNREAPETLSQFTDEMGGIYVPVRLANIEHTRAVSPIRETFLGDTYQAEDTELFREYMGTSAPVLDLAGISRKAKIKWDDWQEFLCTFGVHIQPWTVEKTLEADSEFPSVLTERDLVLGILNSINPFFGELAKAIQHHYKFKGDSTSKIRIKPRSAQKHLTLDPFSHELLRSNKPSDFLTRKCMQGLFKEINREMTVDVSWRLHTNERVQITPKYYESFIAKHLFFLTDDSKLVKSGDYVFVDDDKIRRIMADMGAYVPKSRYGNDLDFLEASGIKTELTDEIMIKLTHKVADEYLKTPTDNQFELYLKHLEAIGRYLQETKSTYGFIENLNVIDRNLDLEKPVKDWLRTGVSEHYPVHIMDTFKRWFLKKTNLTIEDMIESIFTEEHFTDSEFISLLSMLGERVNPGDMLNLDFAQEVRRRGITINDIVIRSIPDLPHVCLVQLELSEPARIYDNIWFVDNLSDDSGLVCGLQLLGWPTITEKDMSITSNSVKTLTSVEAETLTVIFEPGNSTSAMNKPLPASLALIKSHIAHNNLSVCENLSIQVRDQSINIEYVVTTEKILINDHIDPLFRILGKALGVNPDLFIQSWDAGIFNKCRNRSERDQKQYENTGKSNKGHENTDHLHQNAGSQSGNNTESSNQSAGVKVDFEEEILKVFNSNDKPINEQSMFTKADRVINAERRFSKEHEDQKENVEAESSSDDRRKFIQRMLESPNPVVRRRLMNWYGGKCQFCNCENEFTQSNGEPFFVAHFLVPRVLAGHADNPGNAICLCADHFAKLLHGRRKATNILSQVRDLSYNGNQDIKLVLCGKPESIHYHKEHIIALKAYEKALSERRDESER